MKAKKYDEISLSIPILLGEAMHIECRLARVNCNSFPLKIPKKKNELLVALLYFILPFFQLVTFLIFCRPIFLIVIQYHVIINIQI